MWNRARHILLIFFFCCFSFGALGQIHPPEPMADDGLTSVPGEECAEYEGGGTGTPPPPGLCLPVDDYLMPFLFLALLYGAFHVKKMTFSKT